MPEPVARESSLAYDAESQEVTAAFSHTFAEDTEITGYTSLTLWVSAEGSDDADLFVAVQKLNDVGEVVKQRVSHRELDEQHSAPQQPVHTHRREQRLEPGEIVPVEIELWPSSTLFRARESLRVIVKGTDIQSYAREVFVAGHHSDRNKGRHVIHTGGRYDSRLLIPVIPSGESTR